MYTVRNYGKKKLSLNLCVKSRLKIQADVYLR